MREAIQIKLLEDHRFYLPIGMLGVSLLSRVIASAFDRTPRRPPLRLEATVADNRSGPFGIAMTSRSYSSAFVAIVFMLSAVLSATQAEQSRISGQITDGSTGALPGVTVTITSASNRSLTVVLTTGGNGDYETPLLAPGEYAVTFALSGFDTRSIQKVVLKPGEKLVLNQELSVARLSETVEVTAPFLPPPVEAIRIVPPPERPKAIPVDKEILASVCGPRQSTNFSIALGHIVGQRDDVDRGLIGPGDIVRLDTGETDGISTGQNLVVRRRFQTGDRSLPKKLSTFAEQTAGLVQIIEVQQETSTALVVYQCGELMAGDTVEPYQPQLAVTTVIDGTPRFDEPATIVTGEHGQAMGTTRQMMVIDRGIMQGVARGQRLTIFRRSAADGSVKITIGDGIVVAVRADSATFRIERATDAIEVGDFVAIHR